GSALDRSPQGRQKMSFVQKLQAVRSAVAERCADPWRKRLEGNLHCVQAMSSICLLDLLRVAPTTGNARRLAKTMRSLGWVPLKSRRLMPGGFRDTTIRGWARPLRENNRRRRYDEEGAVT